MVYYFPFTVHIKQIHGKWMCLQGFFFPWGD